MATAVLCLGSNVEPRQRSLREALARLSDVASIECASDIAESDDITGRGAPYLNMAVRCSTALDIKEFASALSLFEYLGGRRHTPGEVAIDIDLVIWDNEVVSPDDLSRPYFTPLLKDIEIRK